MEELKLSDDTRGKGFAEDDSLSINYNSVLNNLQADDKQSTDISSKATSVVESNQYSNSLLSKHSKRSREDYPDNLWKESKTEPLNLSTKIVSTLIDEERFLHSEVSELPSKPLVFEEAFAEVWLYDKWVKVEVFKKKGSSESDYLVERIDGCAPPFEVKVRELASFGSYDAESKQQICKCEEISF